MRKIKDLKDFWGSFAGILELFVNTAAREMSLGMKDHKMEKEC
jgi:hypothetical protein